MACFHCNGTNVCTCITCAGDKASGPCAVTHADFNFLRYCIRVCPVQELLNFMDIADSKGIRSLKYVHGCLKNWLAARSRDDDEQEYA